MLANSSALVVVVIIIISVVVVSSFANFEPDFLWLINGKTCALSCNVVLKWSHQLSLAPSEEIPISRRKAASGGEWLSVLFLERQLARPQPAHGA